jgi:hypothetical protein
MERRSWLSTGILGKGSVAEAKHFSSTDENESRIVQWLTIANIDRRKAREDSNLNPVSNLDIIVRVKKTKLQNL